MKPIASTRHTLVLLGIFALVTAFGAMRAGGPAPAGPPPNHVALYLSAIVFEWILFYATLRGLQAAGTPVATLLGNRGPRNFALGVLAWPVIFVVVGTGLKWAMAHGGIHADADSARTVAKIGPHGPLEIALWILVSLSAGICEEFVFRGYLMRQFAAWFGGWPAGLLASAVVFGLGHAYQGVGPVLVIIVHGVSFGVLALLTKSLVPGMTAHAIEDVVSGLSGS